MARARALLLALLAAAVAADTRAPEEMKRLYFDMQTHAWL